MPTPTDGAEAGVPGPPSPAQRDDAGDARDAASRSRHEQAVQRSAADALRDGAGAVRDEGALRRDRSGVVRDGAAEARDRAAELRDRAAEQRDGWARDRDELAAGEEPGGLSVETDEGGRTLFEEHRRYAASDRRDARQDRAAGADLRAEAGSDRAESTSDRRAGAQERVDAEQDRRNAFAARSYGADERDMAEQDRDAAGSDRRASASDRQRASADGLTGAYLRGAGRVELEREVLRAQRTHEPLILGFLDVDHLKSVNDRSGHASGDRLLVRVAATLRVSMRPYDVIVRYGGDEFVCAMPGLDADGAVRRLQAVNAALAEPPDEGSVSFGIAALEGRGAAPKSSSSPGRAGRARPRRGCPRRAPRNTAWCRRSGQIPRS